MMTVKLKLATYLRIILTLNKLTNNNFRKLSSSTFTDLTACQNKKKGRDNVKKKKRDYQPSTKKISGTRTMLRILQ